jgi:protein-disulfide isomerase
MKHLPFGLAGLLGATWAVMAFALGSPWALIPGLAALVAACVGVVLLDLRWGTIVTALLGLGASIYLYRQKVAGGSAACSISSYVDCGKVNESWASEAFGVPITAFGAAYYLAIAMVGFLGARGPRDVARLHQINAVLGLVAVAYSAFLAWVSYTLGALCVVCLTMYAVNVVLCVTGFVGLRRAGAVLTSSPGALLGSSEARIAGVTFALVVAVSFGQREDDTPIAVDWSTFYRASAAPTVTSDDPTAGNPDGRYRIVEYADFGCGHCARAKYELDRILERRNDVALVFKPFPLSGVCNPALPDNGSGHERCDAAAAALCAHRQGRFWSTAELLFVNQGAFDRDSLRMIAEQVDLDLAAWDACMADPATITALRASGASGKTLGIEGTPSFFVRGLFEGGGWVRIEGGTTAIARLLRAKDDGVALPAP